MSSPSTKTQVRRLLVSYEAANAGSAPTTGVARDAALGGLFIETTTPFAIGTLLTVELTSPKSDSAKVTLEGRVFSMRTTPEGPDRPAGMGVRFLDLPAKMMMQLQSILDHHRPPARTQLGVGDEKEALWQAAGGRDDLAPSGADQDAANALAASVVVDGRPTFDPLPPAPPPTPQASTAPEEPRHPTPRMMRAAPPAAPSSQPSSLSGHTLPATPPSSPSSLQPLPPQKTKTSTAIVVVLVVLVVLVLLAAGAASIPYLLRYRQSKN